MLGAAVYIGVFSISMCLMLRTIADVVKDNVEKEDKIDKKDSYWERKRSVRRS